MQFVSSHSLSVRKDDDFNPPRSVAQEEHGHGGDEDEGHVDVPALLTRHSRGR